jgi:hypothetical protein
MMLEKHKTNARGAHCPGSGGLAGLVIGNEQAARVPRLVARLREQMCELLAKGRRHIQRTARSLERLFKSCTMGCD